MILRICLYLTMLLLSYIDIKERKIPNSYLYFLFIFALSSLISLNFYIIPERLIISLLLASILFIVSYFTKGFGMGDVKLVFVTTFITGFFETIISLIIACGIALLSIILVKPLKNIKLPFVPFIFVAYLITGLILEIVK